VRGENKLPVGPPSPGDSMDQVDLLIDLYDSIALTCREVVGDVLSAGVGMGVHSEAGGHVEYEFDKRVERELSSVLSEEAAW